MPSAKYLICLLLMLSAFPSFAQKEEAEDSLVRLVSADTLRQVERNGVTYRRATGDATFLHNNTYLLCDTALWNVQTRIIEAIGHVRIIQDRTELESEKMIYRIDRDLAEFRGNVVQLRDKDNNTLRTSHLDYNTKDSVAVFREGGSMRDKDGQIIESETGTYDSKIKTFTFSRDVNMFTDSIFVKTTRLKYESDKNLATFGYGTNAWQETNMLSADAGWYDRGREIFFFRNNVHVMSETQEGWSDSLYFYRNTMNVDMLGNAQVTDTTRNVSGIAGHINYVDSLSRVTMLRKPAVLARTDQDGQIDTVYFGADTLIYRTVRMCDIDSVTIAEAAVRKSNLDIDPVTEFRRKAAQEAAQKAAEAAANDPNRPPDPKKSSGQKKAGGTSSASGTGTLSSASGTSSVSGAPSSVNGAMSSEASVSASAASETPVSSSGEAPASVSGTPSSVTEAAAADTLSALPVADSLPKPSVADSLSASSGDSLAVSVDGFPGLAAADSAGVFPSDSSAVDSTAVQPLDTTKIGFVTALRNVKIYRKNMQVICDSLEYSDLDSLARLFKSPVIWNEVRQQYSSDSVTAVIRNQTMERVSLMSNAFIHIQEDSTHYDQIRGAEMMAYFSPQNELERFDALGGASAIFYLEENDALATANKKESKMLSAYFKDGNLHRVYYFDTAVSDAYPVAQMTSEDQQLKGFSWTPEKRPADRYAITSQKLRHPQRKTYSAVPRAAFVQTGIYFPGYIDGIYVQIAERDSLEKVRERERAIRERELERLEEIRVRDSLFTADSLKAVADSIARADSLKTVADSLHVADSLAAIDSARLAAKADSTVVLTKQQLREQAKAERAEKRARKKTEKEARWAELDKRDAAKEKAKADKKLAKERRRKLKLLQATEAELMRENAEIEKYMEKFSSEKAKKEAKAAKKAAKEAARKSRKPPKPDKKTVTPPPVAEDAAQEAASAASPPDSAL